MLKISFVVTVYNKAPYLNKVFEGIFEQEGKFKKEIIVINDGSTDDSLKILKQIKKENPNQDIQIFSQKNGGVVKATMTGIKKSTGKYIKFVDADDYLFSNLTEELIKILEKKSNKNLAFATAEYEHNQNPKHNTLKNAPIQYFRKNPLSYQFGGKGKIIVPLTGGSASLMRTKIAKSLLSDTEYYYKQGVRNIQDHVIALEAFANGYGCAFLMGYGLCFASFEQKESRKYSKEKAIKYSKDLAKFYLLYFAKNKIEENIKIMAYKSAITTLAKTMYFVGILGKLNSIVFCLNPYYRLRRKAKKTDDSEKLRSALIQLLSKIEQR